MKASSKEEADPSLELGLHRIRNIAIAVGGFAEKLMVRRAGVSVAESRVLSALRVHPGSTASEVGVRILLTPVQVGRSIARLRKMQFVMVAPHAIDGRAMELWLTRRGEEACQVSEELTAAVQQWAVRNLDKAEWQALDALLDKLVRDSAYSELELAQLAGSLKTKPVAPTRPRVRR
jgi:DNA-binding MarR family transcriptional regulator